MPTELPIQLSRRAEVALDRLPEREKRRISSILERFEFGLPSRNVSKISEGIGGELYTIRVGKLRIILKRVERQLEILDIVNHDKLRQILNTFRRGGDAA